MRVHGEAAHGSRCSRVLRAGMLGKYDMAAVSAMRGLSGFGDL